LSKYCNTCKALASTLHTTRTRHNHTHSQHGRQHDGQQLQQTDGVAFQARVLTPAGSSTPRAPRANRRPTATAVMSWRGGWAHQLSLAPLHGASMPCRRMPQQAQPDHKLCRTAPHDAKLLLLWAMHTAADTWANTGGCPRLRTALVAVRAQLWRQRRAAGRDAKSTRAACAAKEQYQGRPKRGVRAQCALQSTQRHPKPHTNHQPSGR
jgi:hypothetical protein